MATIEARLKKLEQVERKRSGPDRIIVSYPDGHAFYSCGPERIDLAYGDPWPEHDYHIQIVYSGENKLPGSVGYLD